MSNINVLSIKSALLLSTKSRALSPEKVEGLGPTLEKPLSLGYPISSGTMMRRMPPGFIDYGEDEDGYLNYDDRGLAEDIFQFPKIPTEMAKLLVARFFPVDSRPISYESFKNAWYETKMNKEVITSYQYPNYADKPYEQRYQIIQGELNTIIKIIDSYAIPM